jgi:hypothetical protein
MEIVMKCESVRGIRDADDTQTAEAVCLKSVSIPGAQDKIAVTLNVTTEDPAAYGRFERGGVYLLELTKQA